MFCADDGKQKVNDARDAILSRAFGEFRGVTHVTLLPPTSCTDAGRDSCAGPRWSTAGAADSVFAGTGCFVFAGAARFLCQAAPANHRWRGRPAPSWLAERLDLRAPAPVEEVAASSSPASIVAEWSRRRHPRRAPRGTHLWTPNAMKRAGVITGAIALIAFARWTRTAIAYEYTVEIFALSEEGSATNESSLSVSVANLPLRES